MGFTTALVARLSGGAVAGGLAREDLSAGGEATAFVLAAGFGGASGIVAAVGRFKALGTEAIGTGQASDAIAGGGARGAFGAAGRKAAFDRKALRTGRTSGFFAAEDRRRHRRAEAFDAAKPLFAVARVFAGLRGFAKGSRSLDIDARGTEGAAAFVAAVQRCSGLQATAFATLFPLGTVTARLAPTIKLFGRFRISAVVCRLFAPFRLPFGLDLSFARRRRVAVTPVGHHQGQEKRQGQRRKIRPRTPRSHHDTLLF